ncbi:MAG: hypothetical protein GMKNLPBB_01428 [Myxococcota bacterium]|nr:hypothetical protein [Myxococcota bacterium]
MKKAPLIVSAALLALCLITYASSLGIPHFYYDDFHTFVDNLRVRNPADPRAIAEANGPSRFMVSLSFALNFHWFGLDAARYRIFNLAFHAIATLLAYAFCRSLSRVLAMEKEGDKAQPDELFAALTAAIFAVHPLLNIVVVYLTSRSSSLMTIFYLSCLLCFMRFRLTDGRRGVERVFWLLAAGLFFGLSGLTKEDAATLPITLLLIDKAILPAAKRPAPNWRGLWMHGLTFGSVAGAAVFRAYRLTLEEEASPLPRTIPENILTQINAVLKYLALMAAPVDLNIVHHLPTVRGILESMTILKLIFLIVLVVGALMFWLDHKIITIGVLWFFIILAPSSSFYPLQENLAEQRAYLPALGIFMVAAYALAALARFKPIPLTTGVRADAKTVVCASIILLVLMFMNFERTRQYTDPYLLWSDSVAKAPNAWGNHYWLGDIYRDASSPHYDCEKAIAEYEQVVLLRGDYADAWINIGLCHVQLSSAAKDDSVRKDRMIRARDAWERGVKVLEAELRIYPNNPDLKESQRKLWNNLAHLSFQLEDDDAGFRYLDNTFVVDPLNPMAHRIAGTRMLEKGDAEGCVFHFDQALKNFPQEPEAHLKRGNCLAMLNRMDDAFEAWRQVPISIDEYLRGAPNADFTAIYVNAMLNMASYHGLKNEHDKAASYLIELIKRAPENCDALTLLGEIYLDRGRRDLFAGMYERCARNFQLTSKMGRLLDGIVRLAKAPAQAANDCDVHFRLAEYHLLGRSDPLRAQSHARACEGVIKEGDPAWAAYNNLRASIHELRNRLQGAGAAPATPAGTATPPTGP